MNVKLVAISQPHHSTGCRTAEQLIAYCARVSNPSNQNNNETASKLLNYCIRNKHWSIFEQVSLTMEINTTRDIARQILRHKSFSFQEFSQRYADPTQLEYEIRETRLQDPKNRQNSIELDDRGYDELDQQWRAKQEQVVHEAKMAYKWAVQNGIAKEQARAVLPEGNTSSRLFMSGTLRSWIHFCDVRRGNGTQKEHRLIANECWNILCDHFSFLKDIDNVIS